MALLGAPTVNLPVPADGGFIWVFALVCRVSELLRLMRMCSCISRGMLLGMLTTMNLSDSLMHKVRVLAESSNCTVSSLVEQALREFLARDADLREDEEVLPTYGPPSTHPLVDIEDRDQLYAALDTERLG